MRHPLALAAALLAAACSRGPGPVHVTSLRVADAAAVAPLAEAGIDPVTVETAARAALAGAGFELSAGGRRHRGEVDVVSVRLAPAASAGAPPAVEIAVVIELVPEDRGAAGGVRETGSGSAPLSGDPRHAWRSALSQASRAAAEGLALAFAVEAKPLERVIADLGSRDARVRDHAVRVLADRRSAEAVPALIERLGDEDERVVRRAVGALAQIGDERAVAPLIDLAATGDAPLAARITRLIGDIGGAEAEGYLLTVEAGHPDRRVRAAAREALRDLRARPGKAAALSVRR